MASIYHKQNSPFWFIQFIDADGTRRNKSTGLRADDPGQTVQARALRAQLEAKELQRTAGERNGGGWDTWVPQYLERHCETARTLERYTGNWLGSTCGWLMTKETMPMLIKGVPKTLPGLGNFYMAGQWVEPGGTVSLAAASARNVLQLICAQDKKTFTASLP